MRQLHHWAVFFFLLFFFSWPLSCDGINAEVCSVNGGEPTWMLWWKRDACQGNSSPVCPQHGFRSLHPCPPPTAVTGLLFSEFPRWGQSTDVFQYNLICPSSQTASHTSQVIFVTEHAEPARYTVCKWGLHVTRAQISNCILHIYIKPAPAAYRTAQSVC